jgi:hypothetical protein
MNCLIVGNDYLAARFAYLLKKLSFRSERASRFSRSLLKGKDAVFFSGKNCLARSIMDSLRSGCPVFSEQLLFEKKADLSLVGYAERNRLGLSIGSFDVFNPVVREAKKMIENEGVLEIFFSRVGPRQFGYVRLNIVDDLVIQDLGILSHLLEGEAKVMHAFSNDIYNHCIAHLRSKSTNILLYANKNACYKERTADIFSEKTRIRANLLNQRMMFMRSEGIVQSLYGTGYESYRERVIRKSEPLKLAMDSFIKGKSDYAGIQRSLETSLEIKRSIQPGFLS